MTKPCVIYAIVFMDTAHPILATVESSEYCTTWSTLPACPIHSFSGIQKQRCAPCNNVGDVTTCLLFNGINLHNHQQESLPNAMAVRFHVQDRRAVAAAMESSKLGMAYYQDWTCHSLTMEY